MALIVLAQHRKPGFDLVFNPATWGFVLGGLTLWAGSGTGPLDSFTEGLIGGAILGAIVRLIATRIVTFETPAAPLPTPTEETSLRFDASRFSSLAEPDVRFDASRFHAARPQATRSPLVELIEKNHVDIYSADHALRFAEALHGTNEAILERDISHPDCPPDLRRFLQSVLEHYRRLHSAEPKPDVRSIEHKKR